MITNNSKKNQEVILLEYFDDYIRNYRLKCDKKKIKLAEKIFYDTYFENIQDGINSKIALQKAKIVVLCFLSASNN